MDIEKVEPNDDGLSANVVIKMNKEQADRLMTLIAAGKFKEFGVLAATIEGGGTTRSWSKAEGVKRDSAHIPTRDR